MKIFISDLAFVINYMKKITVLFSLLLCLNLNGQGKKIIVSSWNEYEEEVINMPLASYIYFTKGKFYCHISNNSNSLVVDMKITDQITQKRILQEGLTIWIVMDSKLVKETGIRFPVGAQYSGNHSTKNTFEDLKSQGESNPSPLSLANTVEIIGFSGEDSRRIPSNNSDSFRGSIIFDADGNMNYKLILPIAKLPFRNSKDGNGAMPFNLGIEYGAAPLLYNQVRSGSSESYSSSQSGRNAKKSATRAGKENMDRGINNNNVVSESPVIVWIKKIKLASTIS